MGSFLAVILYQLTYFFYLFIWGQFVYVINQRVLRLLFTFVNILVIRCLTVKLFLFLSTLLAGLLIYDYFWRRISAFVKHVLDSPFPLSSWKTEKESTDDKIYFCILGGEHQI